MLAIQSVLYIDGIRVDEVQRSIGIVLRAQRENYDFIKAGHVLQELQAVGADQENLFGFFIVNQRLVEVEYQSVFVFAVYLWNTMLLGELLKECPVFVVAFFGQLFLLKKDGPLVDLFAGLFEHLFFEVVLVLSLLSPLTLALLCLFYLFLLPYEFLY